MPHELIWAIAAISTAVCLYLWFRDVRRIMRDRRSTVESAARQLAANRSKLAASRGDPAAAAVLERSESIYRQAVDLYHQSLRKLWIRIPAGLMGFSRIPETDAWDVQESEPVQETAEEQTEEKERYFGSVRFFKNMILLAVIVMIAVPTGLSVWLGRGLYTAEQNAQKRDEELQNAIQATHQLEEEIYQKELALEKAMEEIKAAEELPQNVFWGESPYADLYPDFYAPQELTAGVREDGVLYLTFDDGPSARTDAVLDILKEKDVKATFFVVGSSGADSERILRRIVEEGHTLAMHSYSHNYTKIYASVEDYLDDMYQIFNQIKEVTGVTPTLFRFPGGSINGYNRGIYEELISEMLRRGFIPYDWNISSADAASAQSVPVNTLVNNVVNGASRVRYGVVLMHDSAAKATTVQALEPMIDRLHEMGFELRALTPEVAPILYSYAG